MVNYRFPVGRLRLVCWEPGLASALFQRLFNVELLVMVSVSGIFLLGCGSLLLVVV